MLCSRTSFEEDILYPHLLPQGTSDREDSKTSADAAADGGEKRPRKRDAEAVSDLERAIREVLDKHYPTPELEMVGLEGARLGDVETESAVSVERRTLRSD